MAVWVHLDAVVGYESGCSKPNIGMYRRSSTVQYHIANSKTLILHGSAAQQEATT